MKNLLKKYAAVSAIALAGGTTTAAHAADSVNVAFFLEWATPNQISKVDKAYDDAMGVDVKWTDFSTGVQMTEAMLAGDIDIAYSQGLAPLLLSLRAKLLPYRLIRWLTSLLENKWQRLTLICQP